MTAPTVPPQASAPDAVPPPHRDPFWPGVRTVTVLELRQRVRSSRWVVVLAVWTAVLALLTALIRWSVFRAYSVSSTGGDTPADLAERAHVQAGRTLFGIIVFLVLSLGALVVPALSSTSINGDRAAGVLATLQTTLLTPVQLVLGKLLAAWTVALALLGCALPFLVWSFVDGKQPIARFLVVLGVLAITLLVICAIGLGWSSITARTSSSTLLTYVSVAFLGLGLPLLFLLTIPLVSTTESVTSRQLEYDGTEVAPSPSAAATAPPSAGPPASAAPTQTVEPQFTGRCVTRTDLQQVFHSERSWWLLAASPYVVVADAAPTPAPEASTEDPLSVIRAGVREARLGPDAQRDYCGQDGDPSGAYEQRQRERAAERERLGVTWPFGLAADLLLGLGFCAIAVRRLHAPARALPRGTRVA